MGIPLVLGFRRIAAICCVAVTCLFSAQTVIVHLDRIEHTLGIDHDTLPLAGPVHHHHHASDHSSDDHDHSKGPHPVSHAHQGDTAFNLLLATSFQIVRIDVVAHRSFFIDAAAVRGMTPGAPERPPKV